MRRLLAFIVDDERLARVALRALLEERGDVEIIGEADSVASAREKLAGLEPDVVFLDVQMPGALGFELVDEKLAGKVVFCTAYDVYAVRAFEVNALDYLVKPIGPEQVERALSRVRGGLVSREPPALAMDDMVALREAHALRLVPTGDLIFIQAADDYSEVHLVEEPSALVDVSLKQWEARLPRDFVRIHRSTLVNLRHVESVQHVQGRWEVSVRGGPRLVVSRRMASDLRGRLGAGRSTQSTR